MRIGTHGCENRGEGLNTSSPTLVPKPIIAITMGDPCGIGPEILCKALSDSSLHTLCTPLIIGDLLALQEASRQIGRSLTLHVYTGGEDISREDLPPSGVAVWSPVPLDTDDIIPAKPTKKTAQAVIASIAHAVDLAMRGIVDGICTAPINKAVLQSHGFTFPGHTEFIQHLTGSKRAVMMLAGASLRVTLVTIHEPLAKVSSLLTPALIMDTIEITASSLERFFGIARPRLAVCGFNPHAGEGGRFGSEEEEIIAPAVHSFHGHERWDVSGPYPPDTVFTKTVHGVFDAVVAMYHDQGLIPLKLLHFDDAVNITLGIPIIRTSVDHGTAYDIAGRGVANPQSLKAALRLAAHMARCIH